MGILVQNVNKLLILTLFLTIILLVKSGYSQMKEISVEKYIIKNFVIPQAIKTNCNWNFLAVELTLSKEKTMDFKIRNQVDSSFAGSLDFLKNYKVINKKQFPLLVFITIQNESGDCGDSTFYTPYPGEITGNVISIINKELELYPKLKFSEIVINTLFNTHDK
jgi:hypothetical protein